MLTGVDTDGRQTLDQSLASLYFGKQITLETALRASPHPYEPQEMIASGGASPGPKRPPRG